jgi:hypothetical protein
MGRPGRKEAYDGDYSRHQGGAGVLVSFEGEDEEEAAAVVEAWMKENI